MNTVKPSPIVKQSNFEATSQSSPAMKCWNWFWRHASKFLAIPLVLFARTRTGKYFVFKFLRRQKYVDFRRAREAAKLDKQWGY